MKYKVRVSSHTTLVVTAKTATSAKSKVWSFIKNDYTYGFPNRDKFMRGVSAKRA